MYNLYLHFYITDITSFIDKIVTSSSVFTEDFIIMCKAHAKFFSGEVMRNVILMPGKSGFCPSIKHLYIKNLTSKVTQLISCNKGHKKVEGMFCVVVRFQGCLKETSIPL